MQNHHIPIVVLCRPSGHANACISAPAFILHAWSTGHEDISQTSKHFNVASQLYSNSWTTSPKFNDRIE